MNYYAARRRESDGHWDYTCMNDGRIWPVGYCAPRVPCECITVETGLKPDPEHEACGGTGRVENPGHCGSHDHPEDAEECFARYLLDGHREESYGDWTGCAICDSPTKKGLTTRPPLGRGFALCDQHRTLDWLRQLAPRNAGQITASY